MTGFMRHLRIICLGLYLLLLVAASVLPSGEGWGGWDASITPNWQNIGHVPAYTILLLVTAWALAPRMRLTAGRLAWVFAACCAIGVLLECAQAYIPGRTAGLGDGLSNALGALLGLALAFAIRRWSNRASTNDVAHSSVGQRRAPRRPRGEPDSPALAERQLKKAR